MSSRYWIAAFAFGLTFSGAAAQNQPTTEDQPRQEESVSNGQDSAESQQPEAIDTTPALQGIEAAIRDLKAEIDEVEQERQRENDRRDLDAQEGMAIWAERMFYVTLATVFLTLAALITIIRTLHHTKLAAKSAADMVPHARDSAAAAMDAAKAAFDANATMQRVGELETRAYLVIENPRLIYSEYGAAVELDIRNVGRSPAYFVTAVFVPQSTAIEFDGDGFDWTKPEPVKHEMARLIGSDVTKRCKFGIRDIHIRSDFHKMDPGKLIKKIALIVEYQTVFDRERSTFDNEVALTLLNVPDPRRGLLAESAPPGSAEFTLTTIDTIPGGWVKHYQSNN